MEPLPVMVGGGAVPSRRMDRQQSDGTDQHPKERDRDARIPKTWLTNQDSQGTQHQRDFNRHLAEVVIIGPVMHFDTLLLQFISFLPQRGGLFLNPVRFFLILVGLVFQVRDSAWAAVPNGLSWAVMSSALSCPS